MSSLAISSFLHEDLAVDPDLDMVPVATSPSTAVISKSIGAVVELPPPPVKSTPAASSGMRSAVVSSDRSHVSLGVFALP